MQRLNCNLTFRHFTIDTHMRDAWKGLMFLAGKTPNNIVLYGVSLNKPIGLINVIIFTVVLTYCSLMRN